jgi:hypothetical protein
LCENEYLIQIGKKELFESHLFVIIKNYIINEGERYFMSLNIIAKEEQNSFISEFKDTKYQELLAIKKEQRSLSSEINSIKFQNQKQSIVSPTDGYVAKLMINTIGGVVSPAEKLISKITRSRYERNC